MNVETLRSALLWCGVINYAVLLLWALLLLLAPGYVRWVGGLFRVPAEQFAAVQYCLMVLYKVGIILFNLVPYIALRIVA
jgi:hypothetical protein